MNNRNSNMKNRKPTYGLWIGYIGYQNDTLCKMTVTQCI